MKILTALFLAVFVMSLTTEPLQAQTAPSPLRLITSPLPITLSATPGATVAAELKVKNGGDQTEHIELGVMKFTSYGEEGKPELLDRERGDDYLSWVTFSQNPIEISPNEWKTVTATFHVPETAAFGYYYAITFSRATEKPTEVKSGTAFRASTAVLVLLDVQSSEAKRSLNVVEFSSDKKIYEFLPVIFTVRVKNTGNVHVAPVGNIFIDRGSKKDVGIIEINAEKGNILPASNRAFRTTWTDGFPLFVEKTDNGTVVLDRSGAQTSTLRWDLSKADRLRFGKYTANLLLIYDDGEKDMPIEGKLEFWVVPWRLFLGLFAVPTVPALIVYVLMKRKMRKHGE